MGPHGKTLLLKTTHAFRRERTTEKAQDIKKSSQTNQEMLSLLASSRRAGPCRRHLLGNYTLTGPSGSSKNLKDMKYWWRHHGKDMEEIGEEKEDRYDHILLYVCMKFSKKIKQIFKIINTILLGSGGVYL